MKMNTPEEKQLLKQFEIVNGCTSDMFDDKDWVKFERFCERQYNEEELKMLEVPMPIYKQETLEDTAYELFKNESGDMSKYRARDLAIRLVKQCQANMFTEEDMLEAFNAGNKRGHSGYPNTDNWTQPTFEDFISAKNN